MKNSWVGIEVFIQLFRKNETKAERNWNQPESDVEHGITWWSGKKLRKKQTTNLNSQFKHEKKNLKFMFSFFAQKATATTKRLNLSSPISPFYASAENFGVYMIYEFKLKRERN